MKVYVAGPITNTPDYKQYFAAAEKRLRDAGHVTMNPAVLGYGFTHSEYMHVCFAMIDVCDAVYMLDGWQDSKGACMEYEYALKAGKIIMFEGEGME